MTKEVFIALIQKDIKELDLIAQGLYETDFPSPTIIKLASSKANDIVANLELLSQVKSELQEQTVSAPIEEDNWEGKEEFEIIAEETIVENNYDDELENDGDEADFIEDDSVEEDFLVDEIFNEEIADEDKIAIEASEDIEEEDNPQSTDKPLQQSMFEEEVVIETTTISTEKDESNEVILTQEAKIETSKKAVVETIIPIKETKIDALGQSQNNSLLNSLANKKIDSLKNGISMGDRFRFQRELFANNGEKMVETLSVIDALSSLDEALSYISNNFQWNAESESVVDFLNLVNRRFA